MIIYIADLITNKIFTENTLIPLQTHYYHRPLIEGLSYYDEICIPTLKKNLSFVSDNNQCNIRYTASFDGDLKSIITLAKMIRKNRKNSVLIFDLYSIKHSIMFILISKLYGFSSISIVTDRIDDVYRDSLVRRFISKCLIKLCDGFIAVTQNLIDHMLPLNNNSLLIPPPTKPIIYNCQTSRFEFKRRIKICYAGSIYKVNGIIELLKATNALHNIELHLYGQIDSNFQNEFRSFLTINSKYHGVLNQDELINSMLDCDILIEPRDNNPIFTEFSYPSKINFYLSFSKPIISTDLIGLPIDVKDLLFIIPSNSPENITEGINRVLNLKYDYLENKMESIRHYTSKNLDYRVLSSKIYSFIKSFNSE